MLFLWLHGTQTGGPLWCLYNCCFCVCVSRSYAKVRGESWDRKSGQSSFVVDCTGGHTPKKKLIKKNHQNIEKRFLYYKCILAWGFRAALEILFVMLCELARRQQFKHSAPICGCCALPLSSVGGNIDWLTTASQRFSLWCVSLICVCLSCPAVAVMQTEVFFFFLNNRGSISACYLSRLEVLH